MSQRLSLSLFALLITAALAAPAVAQEPAKEPAKPAAKPERHPAAKPAAGETKGEAKGEPKADQQIVSTAFGNWSLRCRKDAPPAKDAPKDAPKPARACEISETLEASDHSGPIAKLSIGRPNGGTGALYAVLIVPNNISFPSSVHIRTDDKDIWGLRLDWVRCIPGGCFAQAQLADATVGYWHDLKTEGEIRFPDSTGTDVALPLSFNGFGPALDALNKAQ
jgi:invasion protein IalB